MNGQYNCFLMDVILFISYKIMPIKSKNVPRSKWEHKIGNDSKRVVIEWSEFSWLRIGFGNLVLSRKI